MIRIQSNIFFLSIFLAVSLLLCTGCNSNERTDRTSSRGTGIGLNSEAIKNSIYCRYDIFDVCAGDNNEFYIADKYTLAA